MSGDTESLEWLVEGLRSAVDVEVAAMVTYGHMAAFCRGVDRLMLTPLFEGEAAESVMHLALVREILADLGSEANVNYEFTLASVEVGSMTSTGLLRIALTMEEDALNLYTTLRALAEKLELPTIARKLETLLDQEQESVHEMRRLLPRSAPQLGF